ncbi:MAG: crossover junction endodeoxyribonuclease RuvC [Candidatus Omnitrophota bacterium]
MRIIGVDPALQITGYGIIDFTVSESVHIASGTVHTRACQSLEERLDTIYTGITAILRQHRPDVMVLEKIFVHHAHTTTAFRLGQARGIIVLSAAHLAIPVVEYAATQVKKSVVGNGHATKQQVQRMVTSQLHMRVTPKYFDVTDALALAMAYRDHNRNQDLAQILALHTQ